jgi:hypothetical protein
MQLGPHYTAQFGLVGSLNRPGGNVTECRYFQLSQEILLDVDIVVQTGCKGA